MRLRRHVNDVIDRPDVIREDNADRRCQIMRENRDAFVVVIDPGDCESNAIGQSPVPERDETDDLPVSSDEDMSENV